MSLLDLASLIGWPLVVIVKLLTDYSPAYNKVYVGAVIGLAVGVVFGFLNPVVVIVSIIVTYIFGMYNYFIASYRPRYSTALNDIWPGFCGLFLVGLAVRLLLPF